MTRASFRRLAQRPGAWIAPPVLLASVVAFGSATCSSPAVTTPQPTVRPPAVAGPFYPREPAKLEAAVRAFLADAVAARGERPVALILPHAGYVYSGQIAADGWRQAAGQAYDLVVLLGTNHTTPGFSGISVYPGTGFRTPLGVAEVDTTVAAALLASGGAIVPDTRVHEREHSIEVQVPFAQVVLPGVRILPVIVGTEDPLVLARFVQALARVLAGRRALIVASSDLSHYPDDEGSVAADRAVLAALARLDVAGLQQVAAAQLRAGHRGLETCACGEGAIMVAMESGRALGARRGIVLSRANSADVPLGDPARVVGYGTVMYCAGRGEPDTAALGPPAAAPPDAALEPADQQALLRLARRTLERWFATGTVPLPRGFSPAARRKQGVFVTLYARGELRGCLGHMAADRPLPQNVGAMALAAATEDPRFPPLEPAELKDIVIEISVLTPLVRVAGPEAIVVGRDGVQIRKDGRVAVFLPQVATEQGWNRDALLENLCFKAGLAQDAWKSGPELWTFRSIHFRESQSR
jgi:AmmeMemoRadiSam system protein B/AmmeMemoRadiSam system protein A